MIQKQYLTLTLAEVYQRVNTPNGVVQNTNSDAVGKLSGIGLENFTIDCNEFYTDKILTDTEIKELYYLLLSKYAYSHIRYTNVMSFKLAMFREINNMYPTILKYNQDQKKLREMDDNEIVQGTTVLSNAGMSDANNYTTQAENGAVKLAGQNFSKYTRPEIEARLVKLQGMQYNLTDQLFKALNKHFIQILEPNASLLFGTPLRVNK